MFEETVVVGRHRQRVADAGDHLGSSFDDHLKERRFYRVLPSFFLAGGHGSNLESFVVLALQQDGHSFEFGLEGEAFEDGQFGGGRVGTGTVVVPQRRADQVGRLQAVLDVHSRRTVREALRVRRHKALDELADWMVFGVTGFYRVLLGVLLSSSELEFQFLGFTEKIQLLFLL